MAAALSLLQCQFLVRHVKTGWLPITRHAGPEDNTRASLLRLRLIRYVPDENGMSSRTVLTNKGREQATRILGHWADLLVAAGFLDRKPDIKVQSYRALIDATG